MISISKKINSFQWYEKFLKKLFKYSVNLTKKFITNIGRYV